MSGKKNLTIDTAFRNDHEASREPKTPAEKARAFLDGMA